MITKLSPKDLYSRYLQMRSAVEVLKVMLYDYGITYSPTIVRKFELSQYIVPQLKRLGFTDYIDQLSGVSLTLNINYLEYIQSRVVKNDSFQIGLNLVLSYLQYNQEVDYLESVYSFNSVKSVSEIKDRVQTRQVKLSESKVSSNIPMWLPKTLGASISVHDGYTEVEKSLSSVYYAYLTKVAKDKGIQLGVAWTFLKGVKRKQEEFVLPLILKGSIAVTNEKVAKILASIRDSKGTFPYSEVYELLLKKQEKILDDCEKQGLNLIVRSITPYKICFSQGGLTTYPLYYNYICWDSDNNKALPLVNCFKGLGGEYTRVSSKGCKPYYLRNWDGKLELFYKVTNRSQLHSGNVKLESYLKEFSRIFGDGFDSDGLLISLTPTRKSLIKLSLDRLEQKGVSLVDSDY